MLRICSNINKLINFENTFQKLHFNHFPYSLWLKTVIFIAYKTHSWKKKKRTEFEPNSAQENDAKRLLGNHVII